MSCAYIVRLIYDNICQCKLFYYYETATLLLLNMHLNNIKKGKDVNFI